MNQNLHEARHALTLAVVASKDLTQQLLLHAALHRIEIEMGLGQTGRPVDRTKICETGRSLREVAP